MARRQRQNGDNKYDERVLYIRRVSKKTTGGNYISFSALVAVGDGEGNVGVGLGRGLEVPPAIQKAIAKAKKKMVKLPIYNDTLPHEVKIKFKAARVLLKPAPPGTGLKVGGVVRAVLDIAGVNNASGKIIGTRNQITNAYAVIEAIKKMKPRITKETKTEEKEETQDKENTQSSDQKKQSAKADTKEKKEVKEKKTKKTTSSKATAEKKEPKNKTKKADKKNKADSKKKTKKSTSASKTKKAASDKEEK